MIARLLLPALLLSSAARAALLPSGDYQGGGLTVANGDTLSGVYTNVSSFTVPAGVTGSIEALPSGPNLAMYASTVSIAGVLNGVGRGRPGGGGGAASSGVGANGTGGGAAGAGNGIGALATKGGGGGGGGGAGGVGTGDSGGGVGAAGGSAYGSTGTVTSPISADDALQGSGGGGGGANATASGGTGASGGAAIYIEAASMTVTGSIFVDGSTASALAFGPNATNPGGGGGGGGGTILLRVTGGLTLADGSKLSAKGHAGGNIASTFAQPTKAPGGGGGGGRIKLFYGAASFGAVTLSTAAGPAGIIEPGAGFTGVIDPSTPPAAGAVGSVSFGVVAASPTVFAVSSVYPSSISWTWSTTTPFFGDATATTWLYRVFPSTVTAPFPAPQTTATSLFSGVTEQTLIPNTTYTRFVTAYTDWGDSAPSSAVSTHTLAAEPGAPSFSALAATALTFGWSAGANPSYTVYELNAATSTAFAAPVSTTFAAAVSSSPANLAPNTTYYFRVRAVNLDGVPTAYLATQATATWAAVPAAPAAGPVHITSGVFTWSGGVNPVGTLYTAQVSSDNFFSLTDSSNTLATSATFFTLTPGTQYYLRVRAVNRSSTASAFSTVISTTAGNLSNTTAPAAPGAPISDRAFSYDGTAIFAWAAPTSPVGILDYNLLVGSLPGASDLFAGNVAAASYSAAGMLTGRSYYAQVRARSNAGVYSVFSPVSAAVPVFITAQTPEISKPFTWPSPFNPAQGDAQIGFFLEEAADVVLKIYTLQGRQVANRSRSFGAGNQILTWNGSSDSGMRVAPGGYVAVIEKRYGARVSTQKLKIAVLY